MNCWFNLPSGETATDLEVTIPVKGRVTVSADSVRQFDEFKDLLLESMAKQQWTMHGSLREMLASCLSGYERIAGSSLSGSESVRDDMLVMLRSVVLVLESVVGDHLNHFQKNERIRGAIGVLERHIHLLREEKFSFHDSMWRRDKDLFRWNETERRLREKVDELKRQLITKTNLD